MAPIIAAIIGVGAKDVAGRVAQFLALKALLLGLTIVILPIVLKNVFIWIMQFINEIVLSAVAGQSIEAQVITLSGVGAYLADCLMVPQSLAVVLSATIIRLTLNFIPFVK